MALGELLTNINNVIVRPIILLLFGAAFVVFVWGVVVFIKDADDENNRKKSQSGIIWGIVGMVIMVSVYGIINVIAGTIGVNPSDLPEQKSGPYLDDSAVKTPFE
jgi:hypothetical protein